ncbi:hypothetical protein [Streptomyces sp. NBC_01104]|uniref:hypothetical protein n=1 Tax=Streptomyces sp. NBC_01104 TaxID=2903750 RepID=UPI00386AA11F|nr:hypothetical protein OG450_33275 [Streptomyces sp. NBC_01104]
MRMTRPAPRTRRRLAAAAVLAAVFAAGWYLGQPVTPAQCEREAARVRYSDHLAADRFTAFADRPRLRAWFAGDWRG